MARRKVKNGEKSPWGQCLTRPVPNGRRHSGFWLVPEKQKFSLLHLPVVYVFVFLSSKSWLWFQLWNVRVDWARWLEDSQRLARYLVSKARNSGLLYIHLRAACLLRPRLGLSQWLWSLSYLKRNASALQKSSLTRQLILKKYEMDGCMKKIARRRI